MPELPEVETVKRGLELHLVGAKIASVELRRGGLRRPFSGHFKADLKEAKITGLRRRAKYILADLDTGIVWLSHLGMSGSFRTLAKGEAYTPQAHDHVVITLANGARVVFNDPRRFGVMDTYKRADEARQPALKDIGPEPLEAGFTGAVLARALKDKKTAIKIALLDQSVVAGVGNIYACEALFKAGINPRRPAGKVNAKDADKLADAIKAVMRAALKSGGSTLRNHKQVNGELGLFQHQFAVYGHAGERCKNCICNGKSRIKTITQGGRTTFYCPVKQR